jgi:hypothetical protein
MIDFEKVSWRPEKMGGAIFETTVFEINSNNNLIITPSKLFKNLVPIVIILLSVLPFLSSIIFQKAPSIIIISLVICFDVIMLVVYLNGLKVIELSKKTDSVKKGLNLNSAKLLKKVSEINFIQIIEEPVPNKKTYSISYSYEINLVFNDNTRYNLTDHTIQDSIIQNAKMLKKYIGCAIYTKKFETQEIIEVV